MISSIPQSCGANNASARGLASGYTPATRPCHGGRGQSSAVFHSPVLRYVNSV